MAFWFRSSRRLTLDDDDLTISWISVQEGFWGVDHIRFSSLYPPTWPYPRQLSTLSSGCCCGCCGCCCCCCCCCCCAPPFVVITSLMVVILVVVVNVQERFNIAIFFSGCNSSTSYTRSTCQFLWTVVYRSRDVELSQGAASDEGYEYIVTLFYEALPIGCDTHGHTHSHTRTHTVQLSRTN